MYINTSFNHPPQVIKQLPKSNNERLSKNSSSKEIFNASKYEYETALKNGGYPQTELIFNKNGGYPQTELIFNKNGGYPQTELIFNKKEQR